MARSGTAHTRPKSGLTAEKLFETAVAMADESGGAVPSMRKLADRLGVEAMSLYHYVPNKDAILDGMVDIVFSEIGLPSESAGWKSAMHARAHAARAAMLRHPWAIRLMESRRNPGMATLRHHDAVIGCLRHGGFSIALTAHAFAAIDAYVYGFVLQELTLPFDSGEEAEDLAGDILEQMPADLFPHFIELTREHVLKPGYAFSKEFDYGLELVLDGLERAKERGE